MTPYPSYRGLVYSQKLIAEIVGKKIVLVFKEAFVLTLRLLHIILLLCSNVILVKYIQFIRLSFYLSITK